MTTEEKHYLWIIEQFLDHLPKKRDWLDPALEQQARDAVEQSKPRKSDWKVGDRVVIREPSIYGGCHGSVYAVHKSCILPLSVQLDGALLCSFHSTELRAE